jgi:hypothetical protein
MPTTPTLAKLTRIPPEEGAVRSYSGYGGRFLISLRSRHKHSGAGTWSVYDRVTHAYLATDSMSDSIRQIVRITTFSRDLEQRFLVLPKTQTLWDKTDVVVYDRNTGRWWHRYHDATLPRDLEIMKSLANYLPPAA